MLALQRHGALLLQESPQILGDDQKAISTFLWRFLQAKLAETITASSVRTKLALISYQGPESFFDGGK